MTALSTEPGTTLPPGAATCPGGGSSTAGAHSTPTDFHPANRATQLAAALSILVDEGPTTDAMLRRACRLVLDLSPDPALRLVATKLLPLLKE